MLAIGWHGASNRQLQPQKVSQFEPVRLVVGHFDEALVRLLLRQTGRVYAIYFEKLPGRKRTSPFIAVPVWVVENDVESVSSCDLKQVSASNMVGVLGLVNG